jgi:pyruvate formate lyase activating enzyme
MRSLSAWLAGVDNNIPLHISRFFPRYKMTDRDATPVKTVYSLAETARENLKYVYEGNCLIIYPISMLKLAKAAEKNS